VAHEVEELYGVGEVQVEDSGWPWATRLFPRQEILAAILFTVWRFYLATRFRS
jgi:hypothetical protein